METSLWRSFAIQRRVIGALLMREVITRYGRHNIGFLWLFVEPMIFTLGVMGLWQLSGAGHGHGISPAAFAITGYSSVLLWRNIANRSAHCVEPNLALMNHRNVRLGDILLARASLELVGCTASFLALGILFAVCDWMPAPEAVLPIITGWVMLFWFGTSLGTLLASLSAYSDIVEKIWHPLTYLLFPLSGAVFLVEWLPPQFRDFVLWIPMVHGVELVRHGFFGSAVHSHYDLVYFGLVNLFLTLFALVLLRLAGRRIIPE
jgi:ABC-type polysaccharide/polyol phosphate export permease